MAVFGRRQPHAPIIKTGLPYIPQKPVGRVVVVGHSVRTAADRYYRRSFPPIIKRAGGQPSVAKFLIFGQKTSQLALRPVRRPIWISPAPPAAVAVVALVAKTLIFGQKTSQVVADRFFRRQFQPTIKRAGGQPAVGNVIQVRAQPAYRPVRRQVWISPAPPAPVVVLPPIGKTLVFGQRAAQASVWRPRFQTIIVPLTAPQPVPVVAPPVVGPPIPAPPPVFVIVD